MSAPPQMELGPAVATLLDEAERANREGRHEMARRRYESALYLLRVQRPDAAAMIVRRVARTYFDEGQLETGLDCVQAALAISESASDALGVAHAFNIIAVVHGQRGEVDLANDFSTRARDFARRAGDAQLEAMIEQNMGVAASMRGDFAMALRHFERCVVTYRDQELTQYLGEALNNMGLVYTQLGELDEAQRAYDEAVAHYGASGDTPRRLLALINSAELWIAKREFDRAVAVCVRVLVEADASKDQRASGEANRHLGVVARLQPHVR